MSESNATSESTDEISSPHRAHISERAIVAVGRPHGRSGSRNSALRLEQAYACQAREAAATVATQYASEAAAAGRIGRLNTVASSSSSLQASLVDFDVRTQF